MNKDNPLNTTSSSSLNGSKESKATPTSPPPPAQLLCTKDQLTKISSKLGENWSKLLPKFGITDDDAKKIKAEGKNDEGTVMSNYRLHFFTFSDFYNVSIVIVYMGHFIIAKFCQKSD